MKFLLSPIPIVDSCILPDVYTPSAFECKADHYSVHGVIPNM